MDVTNVKEGMFCLIGRPSYVSKSLTSREFRQLEIGKHPAYKLRMFTWQQRTHNMLASGMSAVGRCQILELFETSCFS